MTALFFPVIGVFIAGLVAYFAHAGGETTQRNLALAALALALILVVMTSFVEEWPELLPWVDTSGPVPD